MKNIKVMENCKMNMTDEQKANELVKKWCDINHRNKDLVQDVYDVVMDMAKWKNQQMLNKAKDKKLSETIEYVERNGFFPTM